MLQLARSFLRPRIGLLYLVLPVPCVQNSRYLDLNRLAQLLITAGLDIVKERLKPGGKLVYFLCRRTDEDELEVSKRLRSSSLPRELRSKITLREGGSRNNFAILLPWSNVCEMHVKCGCINSWDEQSFVVRSDRAIVKETAGYYYDHNRMTWRKSETLQYVYMSRKLRKAEAFTTLVYRVQ